MNIFVLEDDAQRVKIFMGKLGTITWASDAPSAIELLGKHQFDVVFLDHDLGGETFVSEQSTNTGSEVVRWMVANAANLGVGDGSVRQPCIIIHSLNHPAAQSMMLKLVDVGFDYVTTIPFTQLVHDMDNPDFLQ